MIATTEFIKTFIKFLIFPKFHFEKHKRSQLALVLIAVRLAHRTINSCCTNMNINRKKTRMKNIKIKIHFRYWFLETSTLVGPNGCVIINHIILCLYYSHNALLYVISFIVVVLVQSPECLVTAKNHCYFRVDYVLVLFLSISIIKFYELRKYKLVIDNK